MRSNHERFGNAADHFPLSAFRFPPHPQLLVSFCFLLASCCFLHLFRANSEIASADVTNGVFPREYFTKELMQVPILPRILGVFSGELPTRWYIVGT